MELEGFAEDDADEAAEAAITLQGAVLSKKDETWIVEVTVTAPLSWDPGHALELRLADGSTLSATLVPAGTTRAGDVGPGTRVRLVLKLAKATTLQPHSLTLTHDGQPMTVVF